MELEKLIERCIENNIELELVGDELNIHFLQPPKDKSLLLELKKFRQELTSFMVKKQRADDADLMSLSLFYFSSDEGARCKDKYRLLMEGAKFADNNGFEAVWTPERHFAQFGGLYPNPALMASALSTITNKIQLRAGSVVLPLHDPLRVFEEWSVVDNLSDGRVGIAFASGWQPNDFALAPDVYQERHQYMYDNIENIRKLWRGESLTRRNGVGEDIEVSCLPRPIQKEVPIWVTASAAVSTFESAGKIGANILTHLTGQSLDTLSGKIQAYRKARAEAGYEEPGQVSMMIHTFIGQDLEQVISICKKPFKRYLSQSIGLLSNLAKEVQIDMELISESDMDALLEHAFHRYHSTSALLGTPETVAPLLKQIKATGVNEIACLIDFGIDMDTVLEYLPNLADLKQTVMAL